MEAHKFRGKLLLVRSREETGGAWKWQIGS
jgi:hypothetical protein